jgi:hypothetical protein
VSRIFADDRMPQHRELMPLINYARHKALLYKPQ